MQQHDHFHLFRVRDCGLNPDHAIGVIIKICRQRFLILKIYSSIFTLQYNMWVAEGPQLLMPDLPPDSLVIIALDLVLTSCNTRYNAFFFVCFKKASSTWWQHMQHSFLNYHSNFGHGRVVFFSNCLPHLFSIRYKPYYASLPYSNSNLRLLYHLLEEHAIFACVPPCEATFNCIRLLLFFCFGECAV